MKPARKPVCGSANEKRPSPNPLAYGSAPTFDHQSIEIKKQEQLRRLRAESDALLKQMQTPASRAGMERAFNASPEQLGKAAVDAARKRG